MYVNLEICGQSRCLTTAGVLLVRHLLLGFFAIKTPHYCELHQTELFINFLSEKKKSPFSFLMHGRMMSFLLLIITVATYWYSQESQVSKALLHSVFGAAMYFSDHCALVQGFTYCLSWGGSLRGSEGMPPSPLPPPPPLPQNVFIFHLLMLIQSHFWSLLLTQPAKFIALSWLC